MHCLRIYYELHFLRLLLLEKQVEIEKLSERGEADLQIVLTCLAICLAKLLNFRINGMSMVLS